MSVAMYARSGWGLVSVLACTVLAGCTDDADEDHAQSSAPSDVGATRGDGGLDAGASGGPGWHSDAGAIADTVIVSAVTPTGNDRFYAVAYDAIGNIYASGSSGATPTADSQIVVAKFSPTGVRDPAFGNGGYAMVNVVQAGAAELSKAIVVQSDGKIVVAGEAEHAASMSGVDAGAIGGDTDIVLVRFGADGTLDRSFGVQGIVRHDLATGVVTTPADGGAPTVSARDTVGSLSLTSDGDFIVYGATPAQGNDADGGARTDTDYVLLRLNADGTPDTAFGTGGRALLDVGQAPAGARSATVLGDGSILAAGYTTSTALGPRAQQPVLWKVKPDGSSDGTFATSDLTTTPGVWHDFARPNMLNAEAYGAAVQGTSFVTVGYGPASAATNSTPDWIFLRFSSTGVQDKSFGVEGVAQLDVAGNADNGRGLVVLPDNRVLGIGVGRPVAPPPMGAMADGMIAVLGPDGQPDEGFGRRGFRLYDLGPNADELRAVRLSPSGKQVAVVGNVGRTDPPYDDSVLILLTLP